MNPSLHGHLFSSLFSTFQAVHRTRALSEVSTKCRSEEARIILEAPRLSGMTLFNQLKEKFLYQTINLIFQLQTLALIFTTSTDHTSAFKDFLDRHATTMDFNESDCLNMFPHFGVAQKD